MFFYIISDDEYQDYSYTMLVHEVEFSKKQFCMMYNRVITKLEKESNHGAVVEELCKLYDFKIVQAKYEINSCYDNHRKLISNEEMDDEELTFICES